MILSLSFLASTAVMAHARLKPGSATPPRNDSTGLKTEECGGAAVPRGTTPMNYKPGEEITVQWEETINHPGYFIIRFSEADDINFDKHVLVEKFTDTQNEAIASPTDYHQYAIKVKLPNVKCAACTLQLIQVMEENPLAPTKYFSCSDITLSDVPPPNPAPVPVPTTTPSTKPTTQVKPAKPTGVKVEKAK